jgi:hypothetical protein
MAKKGYTPEHIRLRAVYLSHIQQFYTCKDTVFQSTT